MKSNNGEIEVYLCPDVGTTKQKQARTPIPPSDPLLMDILQPSNSNFSPVRAILSSNKTASTNARRNLTFQNCSDINTNIHCGSSMPCSSKSKDPVLHSVGMDGAAAALVVAKTEPPSTSSLPYENFPFPSCADISLDNLNLSPMNDTIKRMFEEPSGSGVDSSETIRLKRALISESDDFGPMGGRYPLTIDDQHSTGMFLYIYICHFLIPFSILHFFLYKICLEKSGHLCFYSLDLSMVMYFHIFNKKKKQRTYVRSINVEILNKIMHSLIFYVN